MSNFTIKEQSSAKYTAILKDETDTVIPLVDITALILSLFLPETTDLDIVNSRDDQNVLNTNNVTVHATSGLLTWLIQPEDTTIVDTDRQMPYEIHRALFEFTFSGGKKGKHTVDLYIQNLQRIP